MVANVNNSLLNGICPYFTMFPLDFPYSVLAEKAEPGEWVLDPFCGRGTTNYASRLLGLPSIGIDSSPVAVAIAQAKLANTTPDEIIGLAKELVQNTDDPVKVPRGEFWDWAFHPDVLLQLCRIRSALLADSSGDARIALRAIILGALHGPKNKVRKSYFSNQCQRTYAPKPTYAVRYWKEREMLPEPVDVIEIIRSRATRYFSDQPPADGAIFLADSRGRDSFSSITQPIKWVITSPPYYGLRTYIPDQWLRAWFLGGKPEVDYRMDEQLRHQSPKAFADDLRQVWDNVASITTSDAQLLVRFGGINNRKADPLELLEMSFMNSDWYIKRIVSAGYASEGRRQAVHINKRIAKPKEEYDVWLTKQ